MHRLRPAVAEKRLTVDAQREFTRSRRVTATAPRTRCQPLDFIDIGAAREKVRVARALESLPLVSEALARGELSYSKARAITRSSSRAKR